MINDEELTTWESEAKARLDFLPDVNARRALVLIKEFRAAREALQGLGAMPEGCCFCPSNRNPLKRVHTGECLAAGKLEEVQP